MTRPTDPLFDQRIADWLEDDPQHAPGQVLDTVLAALPSIPRRRASRVPWRFTTMPTLTRLAAAAVIVVLAVGGAFYVIQRGQHAVVAGPSQTPGLSAGPSEPASPSAVPSPTVVPARAPSWTPTGSMTTPGLMYGVATLLPDGKVLLAGGYRMTDPVSSVATASAELYDPGTGSWTATGNMGSARAYNTATLLPDGKVLVAGGTNFANDSFLAIATAELYDPRTGSWTATGSMTTPRIGHTATLLPDGKVLVAGGRNYGNGSFASAELYDPGSGTWTATGTMATGRRNHTATLLSDGRVLVAGGDGPNPIATSSLASAELYDPGSQTWTATGSMITGRRNHTATLLQDGRVLVAGGDGLSAIPTSSFASAELYDPGTGTWTATGSMVTGRNDHTATLLLDGTVLVAGGDPSSGGVTASAELYDPTTGSWTATGTMATPHDYHTATLLPDGKVLVAGGGGQSAELYDPGSGG